MPGQGLPMRTRHVRPDSEDGETMSAKSKGQSFETRVAEDLKKKGYEILFKSRWARWGMIDFAGLWDIVATRKNKTLAIIGHPDGPIKYITITEWLFVQVKTQKGDTYGEKGKPYRDFAKSHGIAGMAFQFATRNKNKEIEYEVI